eukprot:6466948-Amphidinium_carterae.1
MSPGNDQNQTITKAAHCIDLADMTKQQLSCGNRRRFIRFQCFNNRALGRSNPLHGLDVALLIMMTVPAQKTRIADLGSGVRFSRTTSRQKFHSHSQSDFLPQFVYNGNYVKNNLKYCLFVLRRKLQTLCQGKNVASKIQCHNEIKCSLNNGSLLLLSFLLIMVAGTGLIM